MEVYSMRKFLLFSVFVIILSFHSLNHDVSANSQSFDYCMERLNKVIQKDIESSFPFLKELKEKDYTMSYHYDDLIKMKAPIGKVDTHLNSLISLFMGLQLEIDS